MIIIKWKRIGSFMSLFKNTELGQISKLSQRISNEEKKKNFAQLCPQSPWAKSTVTRLEQELLQWIISVFLAANFMPPLTQIFLVHLATWWSCITDTILQIPSSLGWCKGYRRFIALTISDCVVLWWIWSFILQGQCPPPADIFDQLNFTFSFCLNYLIDYLVGFSVV